MSDLKKKARIRTFSAHDETLAMLESVASYHRLTKSATIAALVKKEFWRIFPGGTDLIHPLKGARVERRRSRKR